MNPDLIHWVGVMLAAFLIDAVIGDPVYPLHPVRLMGLLANVLERLLRRLRLDGVFGGFLLVIGVVMVAAGGYACVRFFALKDAPVVVILLADTFVVYSSIALGDLIAHARRVRDALEHDDLAGARVAVQMIVGRDANLLDRHGVARAAVESVAENFVDGILSPLFWYAVAGGSAWLAGWPPLPVAVAAILAFKAVSTLDSTVGYRNERYERFGKCAARLDDLLNFVPARLAVALIATASLPLRLSARACARVALRDRRKHASPNSAHAESAVAGALAIRLGGPTTYPHGVVEKPWLGDGPTDTDATHIRTCCALIRITSWLSFLLLLGLMAGLMWTEAS